MFIVNNHYNKNALPFNTKKILTFAASLDIFINNGTLIFD